jgi:hypothetical protein
VADAHSDDQAAGVTHEKEQQAHAQEADSQKAGGQEIQIKASEKLALFFDFGIAGATVACGTQMELAN